jgi:hypothetical protein
MKLTNKLLNKYYSIRHKGGLSGNDIYNEKVLKMTRETYRKMSLCHSSALGIMGGQMTLKQLKYYWDIV